MAETLERYKKMLSESQEESQRIEKEAHARIESLIHNHAEENQSQHQRLVEAEKISAEKLTEMESKCQSLERELEVLRDSVSNAAKQQENLNCEIDSLKAQLNSKIRDEKILQQQLEDFRQIAHHSEANETSLVNQLKQKIAYLKSQLNVKVLESSLTAEQMKLA